MKTLYDILPLRSLLLLVVALFLVNCADDGPAGPAGPAGPEGPAGSPNVIYGTWFKPESYDMTTIFSIKTFAYTREVPAITQEILDKGVVLVYAKLLGYNTSVWPANQVGQLPVTLTYSQGGQVQSDFWSAQASAGNLKITFVNNANFYSSLATQHEFRYVVVPGGVAATGGRVAGVSADYITRLQSMSYSDAMAELGIPE